MVFAYIGCTAAGFLAGLFTFRVKSHWCTVCGDRLQCVDCLHRSGALGTATRRPSTTPNPS